MKHHKPTASYRNDPESGIPADVREYVDKHYLEKLNNLERVHPKILVVFSGGNAVGKSTLAQRMSDSLGALVIENDAVKETIVACNPLLKKDERNRLTWQYTMDLYRRLPQVTTNGLVVRDGIIDWYYDRILPVFLDQGYSLFVVAYEISTEKNAEIIRARGDRLTATAEQMVEMIPEQRVHQDRFRKKYKPDVILNDSSLFNHEEVLQLLKQKIVDQQG